MVVKCGTGRFPCAVSASVHSSGVDTLNVLAPRLSVSGNCTLGSLKQGLGKLLESHCPVSGISCSVSDLCAIQWLAQACHGSAGILFAEARMHDGAGPMSFVLLVFGFISFLEG